MLRNYLKNVNAIMLMYDTTNRSTLQHLTEWYRRIVTELGPVNSVSSQPIKFVVVGGKTDVVRTRQVSLDDHKKTVEQLGAAAGYFCSSKMNEGVSSSFRYTAADLLGIDSKTVEDKVRYSLIDCLD
jgi:GTPase SAR1 family protein